MIEITANTRQATVTNKELLTTGSAGIQVQFTLSDDFTGLACMAVFRQGEDGKKVDVALDNSATCVVPAEVLTEEGEVLFIGIYGANGQGTIIIPTVWAAAGVVKPGTDPNTPAEAEPTPEIWAQILSIASDAEQEAGDALTMATRAANAAEEAVNSCTEDRAAAEFAASQAQASSNSATSASNNAWDGALKSEGYAVGKQDGTSVQSGTYFENNAAYYAGEAEESATSANTNAGLANAYRADAYDYRDDAAGFAVGKVYDPIHAQWVNVDDTSPYYENNAEWYATQAESWAVGGTDTRTGEDTNNAKYWADQAAESAATLEIDDTLSISGRAADAKAAGDAIATKVDKVVGKGLSTEDYTTAEKTKLSGIAAGAEVNVQSDWNQTSNSADDYIKNKPANLVQDASYVHTDNNYTDSDQSTVYSNLAHISYLNDSLADDYSSSSTYNVGDYVMRNYKLYRCNTTISTAESWTSAHWTQVALADDVKGVDAKTLPSGGTARQFLMKSSNSNYAVEWSKIVEGDNTVTTGNYSHAEGSNTQATANVAHAEGYGTKATGNSSHAEGNLSTASGNTAHAEGNNTEASGTNAHAEGDTTIANHRAQHVFGAFNVADESTEAAYARGNYVEIVGNGTANNARSNARTLDWDGNEELAGDLTIFAGTQNEISLSDLSDVNEKIENSIAFDFDASESYSAGDYVYHNNLLLRFAKDHTGAWDAEDAEEVEPLPIADENLKKNKADIIVSSASGAIAPFPDGARYLPVKELVANIEPVQSGSGDPSPDNIRPISGWTGAIVTRAGKNLLPNISGARTESSFYIGQADETTYPTHLISGVTYTISFNTNLSQAFVYMKENGGSTIYFGISGDTYTPTSDMDVQMWVYNSGLTSVSNFQLEVGSSATDYEEYQGTTIEVTFPDEAGTVYGGTLTKNSDGTGTLVVDRAGVDMGSLTYSDNGSTSYGGRQFLVSIADKKNGKSNISCSCFAYIEGSAALGTMSGREGNTNVSFNYEDITTSAFKTAMDGQTLVYELTTPVSYTLTAEELGAVLTTLYGTNNIWADTGDISVDYRADTRLYIEKLTKPTEDDMIANTNIASGKFFMVGNNLYLSTQSIASGAAIVPGTNCTALSLADALNNINT